MIIQITIIKINITIKIIIKINICLLLLFGSRDESTEQGARAESREQRTRRAESSEQRADSREQEAEQGRGGSREQRAGSREHKEQRQQSPESRRQRQRRQRQRQRQRQRGGAALAILTPRSTGSSFDRVGSLLFSGSLSSCLAWLRAAVCNLASVPLAACVCLSLCLSVSLTLCHSAWGACACARKRSASRALCKPTPLLRLVLSMTLASKVLCLDRSATFLESPM